MAVRNPMSGFFLVSFLVFIFVSKRMREVVLRVHSDHLDSDNSDPSPCLALLLQIPECLNILFCFLILPFCGRIFFYGIHSMPLLIFPSLKFLKISGEVAMKKHGNLHDITFKTQNQEVLIFFIVS